MSPDLSGENHQHTRQGILLIIIALSMASVVGSVMKLLSTEMSAYQVTWFRFLGFSAIILPIVLIRLGKSALLSARPGMQIIRGLTMAGATLTFVLGSRTIDYADAVAIVYAYPFLLVVLSVIFLKERVDWVGWAGVSGGFVGVLLVVNPDFENFNTGSVFVFACAVILSVQMVLNRKLGAVSHPLVTSAWGAVIATFLMSIVLPFVWVPVDSAQLLWIAILMVMGTLNQVLIVFAFAKAPASVLAPFTYIEVAVSIITAFIVFGTWPIWISWLGIALIIVSGLFVAQSLPGRVVPRRQPKI